jgi:precorrin-8X/cobalt-precorrin-8 methylmutase
MPLFDAYVIVDWSGAAAPARGSDSIWIGCLEWIDGSLIETRLSNPPTRRLAASELLDLLTDLIARDRMTLAGFDFAFGFPQGFARRLRSDGLEWQIAWKEIAGRIQDGNENENNRFDVAAQLNEAVSGRPFPFWGCPRGASDPMLSPGRPDGFDALGELPEFRLTERVISGPQSVWKMAYAGSVGSQTLLGLACLQTLRHHVWLAENVRIWPFETGLRELARPPAGSWQVIFAEVYPSMIRLGPGAHAVRDAGQVRTLGRHFAKLDSEERLAPLFAGPAGLTPDERRVVEREEGWILGIDGLPAPQRVETGPAQRYVYLRDPAAIYRASFERIRAEADLSRLPLELEPLAVRLIHASGDPTVAQDLVAAEGAVETARAALSSGAPILVDTEMVAAGIIQAKLPAGNRVLCMLGEAGVSETAEAHRTTRSAAAVDLWRPFLEGAVVVIGNAPTALFRLLELIDGGAPPPAVVLGFPVGFVGAAESKDALIAHPAGVPFLALRGRRGGSALAAAAVNALAGSPV